MNQSCPSPSNLGADRVKAEAPRSGVERSESLEMGEGGPRLRCTSGRPRGPAAVLTFLIDARVLISKDEDFVDRWLLDAAPIARSR
jgi:hypothetical protein